MPSERDELRRFDIAEVRALTVSADSHDSRPHPCVSSPAGSIAYTILAHADPAHFGRLLRRLASPRASFIVHVDAKADQRSFEREAEGLGVTFVRRRVRVMWAGFSVVEATLRLFETAHEVTDARCTHFVLLSGADYPIASTAEIHDFFSRHPARQFIRRYDILRCGDKRQMWRLKGYHFRELADRHTFARRPLFVIEQALRILERKFPPDLTVAAGSQWCVLTRDCAAYCATFARAHPEVVRLFKHTFAPDETFLHTLIENSPFLHQAEPLEPYVDVTGAGGPWHYGNLHFLNPIEPIRTTAEARTILRERSGQLFARKFDTSSSAEALAVIDAALGRHDALTIAAGEDAGYA